MAFTFHSKQHDDHDDVFVHTTGSWLRSEEDCFVYFFLPYNLTYLHNTDFGSGNHKAARNAHIVQCCFRLLLLLLLSGRCMNELWNEEFVDDDVVSFTQSAGVMTRTHVC